MNLSTLFRLSNTSKNEIIIILICLIMICFLPIVALFSIEQTSIVSLAESSVDVIYQGAISKTDTYDWGNCTYWAALLRQQADDPIPNSWGNAADWAKNAQADGYLVDHVPAVGAIMQISNVDNGLGHVAYVKSVNPTSGDWSISEMNVKGYDIVDMRTYSAQAALEFNFIHDRNI
jgi:surface antigen